MIGVIIRTHTHTHTLFHVWLILFSTMFLRLVRLAVYAGTFIFLLSTFPLCE